MKDPAQLLHDYFSGELSPADEPLLRAYLWEKPEHAQEFMRLAHLHNSLHSYYHLTDEGVIAAKNNTGLTQIAAKLQLASGGIPAPPPQPLPISTTRLFLRPHLWAIAALLILAAIITLRFFQSDNTHQPSTSPTIAAHSIPSAAPDHPPTDMITLATGTTQYTFAHNARVLLQAPATFRIVAPNRLRLFSGRVTTLVPKEAAGFTIDIPSGSVVDLGTEVGINVTASGNSHIEVFTGRAGIRLDQTLLSAPFDRILTAGDAATISLDPLKIESTTPYTWVFTRVAQAEALTKQNPTPAQTWASFVQKLHADPTLLAHYAFTDNTDNATLTLPNLAPQTHGKYDAQLLGVTLTPGRFTNKKSPTFTGSDSRALLDIPVTTPQLTIAAWVKVHFFANQFNAILVSEDVGRVSACHFQLRDDSCLEFSTPHESDPLTFYHYPFFSPKVFDSLDRWAFVAVTYDADQQNVACYIDGELITVRPLEKTPRLRIGAAEIGNWTRIFPPRTRAPRRSKAFDGAIDDLLILSRTLDAAEIQSMYQAGLPDNK